MSSQTAWQQHDMSATATKPPSSPSPSTSWIQLLRIAQPAATLVALFCIAVLTSGDGGAGRRRRRTKFIAFVLLALLLTYFASGALLVLRAVTTHVWTPELPLWRNVDYQTLFELVALGSTLTLIAWQQRQNGIGRYGVASLYTAGAFGGITDVAILVLYGLQQRRDAQDLASSPWTWAQIALQVARILILWPLLVVLAEASGRGAGDGAEDESSSEDARLAANSAQAANAEPPATTATAAARSQPNEQTSLLGANTSTSASGPSSYGTARPAAAGKTNALATRPSSSAASANASMGLSVASAPPPPTFRVFLQRIVLLFPYLWPSKSAPLQALAVLCVFILLAGRMVNLAVPLILGRIVDRLASNANDDASTQLSVWWLIGGYAALKCLQGSGGLLVVMQNFAWLPLQQYSDRQMSLMAFRHLLDLSMSFHTKRKTGEVLRILDRGSSINNFFQYLIFSVAPIFFDIFIATGFLSLTFGPQVGLLLFGVMFVYTAISIQLTTWRTSLRRDANNKDSVSRAIHTDVLLNWETVKSYNNEGYESERYRLSLLDYQRAEWKVNASLNVLNLVQNLTLSVGTLLMLFVVAYDVVQGYASSSDFVVFISYLAQIYGPLNMLSTLYRVIQTSLVDTDKLIALLGEEKDVKDVSGATELEVHSGVVEFRNVKFSYDGKVEALKGLNFTIKPKSKVALVGESGAGKSSVLRLLYRFYDPSSGQILIDGQDIRKVTQHSLRRAIGVVPQEAGLLNTSIRTNIGYGRTDPPASDEEIDAAAAAAQILDKIQSFPEGMSTVVGERGVRLSGGEKQRVAIARTFLKAPPVLLLDEATSALDSQTERQLQSALETLMAGKTSLTIAHRLSTIVNSDQILVLHEGQVVESGTHEELIAVPGGRYRKMWQSQVETRRDEEARRQSEREGGGGATDGVAESDSASGAAAVGHAAAASATDGNVAVETTEGAAAATTQKATEGDARVANDVDRSRAQGEGEANNAAHDVDGPRAGEDADGQPTSSSSASSQNLLAAVQEVSGENSREASSVAAGDNEGDTGVEGTGVAADDDDDDDNDAAAESDAAARADTTDAAPSSPRTSRQISLSRHSTRSAATHATQDHPDSIATTAATSTTDGGKSASGGGGRMRQRFASLMRRSTSGSHGGGGGGSEGDDAGAAPPPPASPTMRSSPSPTLLKRSLSTRSNRSEREQREQREQQQQPRDAAAGASSTSRTSSPRLGSAKQLFGGGGGGGGNSASRESPLPSPSASASNAAAPTATTKPISTSGVSAGGKKKKGKKGKRK